jgi:HK97 family phage major capsid protein
MARHYVNNSKNMPGSPEELAAMLSDPVVAAQKMGGSEDEWREFQSVYAAKMSAGGDLTAQIREQTQLVLAEVFKNQRSNGASPLDLTSAQSARQVAARSAVAPGAALNGLFTSLGELIQAGVQRNPDPDVSQKLSQLSNSFGSTVPADGGFLVPELFRSDIQMLALETAVVRPRATVFPMSSLRLGVPAVDDTSHASSVFGGLVGYWTEEGAALTESQASFERIVLDAKKLTVYGEIPNELLADAPAMDAFVRTSFAQATAFFEDVAFMRGTGVGEPFGFVGCPAMVSVTRDTASRIKWPDIVGMFSRMLPDSLSRAVWIASPGCIPDLLQMQIQGSQTGGGTTVTGGPALIGYGAGGQAAPTSILGRPLIFTEKVPDLATANALTFVDLAYYLVGDRQQMSLETSQHYKFGNDKTAVRLIERVDGRPWINSAITPRNGGSTLSPYVGIA